jgi:hypothetical protein
MQPLEYQTSTTNERKAIILKIAKGLREINKDKFPKIAMTAKAGNNKKNQLINLVIEQMYSNDMELERCFLAVEENI